MMIMKYKLMYPSGARCILDQLFPHSYKERASPRNKRGFASLHTFGSQAYAKGYILISHLPILELVCFALHSQHFIATGAIVS
ncbi:hypothetical protein H5410_028290 [Solanum commersonii]|uniref:Uncharacterized protein n=1 Tax=Solanum commersonii TaxID=4109 RepID=A0A9J5Z721_SOLCO|nr:hypothetical protein H5410_028290 [Solanum commersonii]